MHEKPAGSLTGKVAVVTGAGRGIGRAIALGFAEVGASVCCVARTASEVESVAYEIESRSGAGQAFAVAADVVNPTAVDALYTQAVERFGGVDIVMINHGISLDWNTVEHSNVADWMTTFDVNVHGAYHCARLGIPHLKRRGGGNIIMMGSGQGHRGSPGVAAYACSKAALWMLVRVLADELRTDRINVNEILPGPVRTTLDRTRPRTDAPPPPRPAGDPIREADEIVPLAVFLATQPPNGPTGQSFSMRRQSA